MTPVHATVLDFSIAEWRHEKAFHIEDAYKWLFQATLGGEHAVSNSDEVRGWMDREWKSLGAPRPGEPMTVQLRPDGKLFRFNLRPFKAAGGSEQAILIAFVRSAKHFRADKEVFRREWRSLGEKLRSRPLVGLTESEWLRLEAVTGPAYPAIDHSPENLRIEDPAYRVVDDRSCRELIGQLKVAH